MAYQYRLFDNDNQDFESSFPDLPSAIKFARVNPQWFDAYVTVERALVGTNDWQIIDRLVVLNDFYGMTYPQRARY